MSEETKILETVAKKKKVRKKTRNPYRKAWAAARQ
jgi:hypothetical protein